MKQVLLAVAFILFAVGMQAQSSESDSLDQFFLLQNDVLLQLDVANAETRLVQAFSSVQAFGEQIVDDAGQQQEIRDLSAVMNPDGTFIYVIRSFGFNTTLRRHVYGAPTGSQLLRWDVATGQETVLLPSVNVFNVFPSPDGKQAVVLYYEGDFMNSRPKGCVFVVEFTECNTLKFNYIGSSVVWVDNTNFVLYTNDLLPNNPLRLVSSITYEQEILEFPPDWYIYNSPTIIPSTRTVLASATLLNADVSLPAHFLAYNLDTGQINQLPFTTLADPSFVAAGDMQFSPDGRYLFYRSGTPAAVSDFQTGGLIARLDNARAVEWVDNTRLLIQGVRDNELQIYMLDVPTGATEVLLRGEAATGILLVAGER